ncbi:MAG: hypothetical protein LQ338_005308 [Usnochroma carphineum]|nr:MAG: hypothetical protein LQ338_005308 [Usnochroma carphineum]
MSGMHDRIVQLERLVRSMASKPIASPNLDFSSSSQAAEIPHLNSPIDGRSDHGSMRVSDSELHYVGGDHWTAILDSIADLKDHFDREEQLKLATSSDQIQNGTGDPGNLDIHASRHSLLLYGGYRPASHAEILACLPPKGAVDRYVSRYFSRQELVSCKCGLSAEMRMTANSSDMSQLPFTVRPFFRR